MHQESIIVNLYSVNFSHCDQSFQTKCEKEWKLKNILVRFCVHLISYDTGGEGYDAPS